MLTRIASLLLVAVLLVACGGSSSSGGGAKELSKADWITAADKICGESKAARDALPQPQSPADLVKQLGSLVTILEKEQADLKALVPPSADKAQVSVMLAAAGQQVTLAKGLQDVAKAGDVAKIQAYIDQNDGKIQEAKKLAGAYGLKVCGAG